MEPRRLKNIAILILLLLDACLLLMAGGQKLQALGAQRRAEERLRELYRASQLALGEELDLAQPSLGPQSLTRRAETERSIASALLGGEAVPSSQGGGIYSYETDQGSIQFRAGGSFYGSGLRLPVGDIGRFARSFCAAFGYGEPELQLEDGDGRAAAAQRAGGVSVANCGVELYFENGLLVSVTGAHVSLEAAAPEPGGRMDCVTALLKFLDHRNAAGVVCSEVADARCVYQLQGASAPRLLPAWEIQTDTGAYYVDCGTGEVYGK